MQSTFQGRLVQTGVRCIVLTIVGAVLASSGCDIPKRPPLVPADLADSREAAGSPTTNGAADATSPAFAGVSSTAPETFEGPIESFNGNWETWDLYYIGDQPVGYNHVRAEAVDERRAGSEVRYQVDNVLYVNQGKARTLQRLMQTSSETRDGALRTFESQMHVGSVVTRFDGNVDDGQLTIQMTRGSSPSTRTIPWNSNYRGLVAIEQSLRRKPLLNKDETRSLKLLLPGQYAMATARLRCSGKASVPLVDQKLAELTEINYEIQSDGQMPSYSTIWIDSSGAIVRTFSPGFNLVSYRTDAKTAADAIKGQQDVVALAVTGTFERPSDAKRLAIMVAPNASAKQANLPLGIEAYPGQLVRDMGDGTYQVLLSRNKEVPPQGFRTSDLEPQFGDSGPNHFIDSGNPLVSRFASAAVGARELSQQDMAVELARTVYSLIGPLETPRGLVRASDVARDGVGDSTGRSILLAALLRSRGIPARVAIGLRYNAGPPQRMVYQMWTMAYVEDHWINLDATEGIAAPPDRITFSTTDLSGGKEYNAFLPFIKAVSRIDVNILRAQY